MAVDLGTSGDLIALLIFGALALLILTWVYITQHTVNSTSARMYGLILVAALGVALAFSNITSTALTAGFTLLGTIAGYLAGAKTQTTSATSATNSASLAEGTSGPTFGESFL